MPTATFTKTDFGLQLQNTVCKHIPGIRLRTKRLRYDRKGRGGEIVLRRLVDVEFGCRILTGQVPGESAIHQVARGVQEVRMS